MNTATTTPTTSQSALAKAVAAWGAAAVATGKLGYDVNKFYCKATDPKGHGERLAGKVPPEVYARIQQVVHSDDFPDYSMPMDFVRDAIVHHLARRQDQIGDMELREQIGDVLRRVAFEEFSAMMEAEVDRWETIHERMRVAFTALMRSGAWGQMWEYIRLSDELIDGCPEPYRSLTMGLINEWRGKVPEEFRT